MVADRQLMVSVLLVDTFCRVWTQDWWIKDKSSCLLLQHVQGWWIMAASGLTQWGWCCFLWKHCCEMQPVCLELSFIRTSDNLDRSVKTKTEKLGKKQSQHRDKQKRESACMGTWYFDTQTNRLICFDAVPIQMYWLHICHTFLMLLQGNTLNLVPMKTKVSHPYTAMKKRSDISKSNGQIANKWSDHIHTFFGMNPFRSGPYISFLLAPPSKLSKMVFTLANILI